LYGCFTLALEFAEDYSSACAWDYENRENKTISFDELAVSERLQKG
jgi:hypothetical protein